MAAIPTYAPVRMLEQEGLSRIMHKHHDLLKQLFDSFDGDIPDVGISWALHDRHLVDWLRGLSIAEKNEA